MSSLRFHFDFISASATRTFWSLLGATVLGVTGCTTAASSEAPGEPEPGVASACPNLDHEPTPGFCTDLSHVLRAQTIVSLPNKQCFTGSEAEWRVARRNEVGVLCARSQGLAERLDERGEHALWSAIDGDAPLRGDVILSLAAARVLWLAGHDLDSIHTVLRGRADIWRVAGYDFDSLLESHARESFACDSPDSE